MISMGNICHTCKMFKLWKTPIIDSVWLRRYINFYTHTHTPQVVDLFFFFFLDAGTSYEELPSKASLHYSSVFFELHSVICHCHCFWKRPLSMEAGLECQTPSRSLLCKSPLLLFSIISLFWETKEIKENETDARNNNIVIVRFQTTISSIKLSIYTFISDKLTELIVINFKSFH